MINDHAGTDLVAPTVTLDGTVAPGQSPGVLTVGGNAILADAATFLVEINGTAGTGVTGGHDQLSASGTVVISGSVALAVSGAPSLSGGEVFTIISRVGGSGTFTGLAEGASIANFLGSGLTATITYAGGVGSDDVLITVESLTSTTPGQPDLVAAFDTGQSSSDDITRLDNSSGANLLQFDVPGTVSGATVTVYAGDTQIGSAVATGTTTSVTTNGTFDLADGFHTITARQEESGKAVSSDSSGLSVQVDTQAPTASTPDLADASDTGWFDDDNVTRGITPTFEGTAGDGGSGIWKIEVESDDDKDRLLRDLYTMVDRRFRLACELATSNPWDFFMMVEIATDRIHHGFWRYGNPDHPLYEKGNPYETAIRDFYSHIDTRIGSLLARLDDDTTVLVVSDHGAMTLAGGVAINEWLIKNGFLKLRSTPTERTAITPDMVDWSETTVWSEGGYYARIFLNVKDREPNGTIDPAELDSFRNRLADLIRAIPDENGIPMNTRVLKPEEIYRGCSNVPPDLIVYFDDLKRRSIGTVGTGDILQYANDTGPDDANHHMEGILIRTHLRSLRSGEKGRGRIDDASILDITPTVLSDLSIPVPCDLAGNTVVPNELAAPQSNGEWVPGAGDAARSAGKGQSVQGFTATEEEIVKKRLEELGYI